MKFKMLNENCEDKILESQEDVEVLSNPDLVIENNTLISYNGNDAKVIIPDGVISIGEGAFENCTSITNIMIPDSVTEIMIRAFYGCTNLDNINISNVTFIGDYAFCKCTSLTSIIIPSGVIDIKEGTFADCSNLANVIIEDGVTSIDKEAFYNCCSLIKINIPSSVLTIGDYAFENCKSLINVTIPDSVNSIGKDIFLNCNKNLRISCSRGSYINMYASDNGILYKLDLNESAYEDDIQEISQEFTSENTSINSSKLPAIFRMVKFEPGTINIDYGGGKFDNVAEYLTQYDVVNLVYDPYNRTSEHNKEVLNTIRKAGGADTATCSNVLNVIKEPEVRNNVLNNIKKVVKPGGKVYITVYEGTGKGDEGATKSGYQLNRKTSDYMEEILQVFPDAVRKAKLIVATNGGSNSMKEEYDTEIEIPAPYNKYYDLGKTELNYSELPDAFDHYKDIKIVAEVHAKEEYEDSLAENGLEFLYLVSEWGRVFLVTTIGLRVYPVTLEEVLECVESYEVDNYEDDYFDEDILSDITGMSSGGSLTEDSTEPFKSGDRVYVTVSNRAGTVTKMISPDVVEVEFDSNGIYPSRIDKFYTDRVKLIDYSDIDDDF